MFVESDGVRSERAFFWDAGVKKDSRARFLDILKIVHEKNRAMPERRGMVPSVPSAFAKNI